jgi:hypothetical protein
MWLLLAMTRHLRFLNAERNIGLMATVSARALMQRAASFVSLDQLGINPHFAGNSSRPSPVSRTQIAVVVGATLKRYVQTIAFCRWISSMPLSRSFSRCECTS